MNTIVANMLGIGSIALIGSYTLGIKLPVINNDKAAMTTLIVLGMAACTGGIGKVAAINGWAHPVSILGYLAGGLMLVIAAATWMGKTLPLIPDGRAALIAVMVLMLAKYGLTLVHPLLH